jgi:radical SAM-linked protein
MSKLRLLFVKEGSASYISHLDLMRTFQRVFPRTGLSIAHSHGFHPHPILSIVLPLPVAQSSGCELLDFEVTQQSNGAGVAEKMNGGLPSGIRAIECYEAVRPVRELAYVRATVTFTYDRGVPQGAAEQLTALFSREELTIQKRTKRKELADVDIAPLLHRVALREEGNTVVAEVVVSAQNPGLNPILLEKAIEKELPELTPDFTQVRREAILDANEEIFR